MRPGPTERPHGSHPGTPGSTTSDDGREGSQDSARKRKRASKPKVRTGCITW